MRHIAGPSCPIIMVPMSITMKDAGSRKAMPALTIEVTNRASSAVDVVPNDCNMGISRNIIGVMNTEMSSLRLVKALKSLFIMAASVVVNPSLPSKPVFGV